MDIVGGFVLADGTEAKALTGVDDHSRFCVSACLMPRETSRRVCEGLALAMRTHGVPEEILTDNGKVFTGRFNRPPVEVLFDRICRENGDQAPADPAAVADHDRQDRAVPPDVCAPSSAPTGSSRTSATAQAELDEWVEHYNTERPHQAIGMDRCRRERFEQRPPGATAGSPAGAVSGAGCRTARGRSGWPGGPVPTGWSA